MQNSLAFDTRPDSVNYPYKDSKEAMRLDEMRIKSQLSKLSFTAHNNDTGEDTTFQINPSVVVENFWIRAGLKGENGTHRIGLIRTFIINGFKMVTASIVVGKDKFHPRMAEILCNGTLLRCFQNSRALADKDKFKLPAGQIAFIGKTSDIFVPQELLADPVAVPFGITGTVFNHIGVLGATRKLRDSAIHRIAAKLYHNLTYVPPAPVAKPAKRVRARKLRIKELK